MKSTETINNKIWLFAEKFAAITLSLLLLVHQTGCSYAYQPIPVSKDVLYSQETLASEALIYITTAESTIKVTKIKVLEDRIEGDFVELSDREEKFATSLDPETPTSVISFSASKASSVLRIIANSAEIQKKSNQSERGTFSLPITTIQSVRIFELDEKLLWRNTSFITGSVVLTSSIVPLILVFLALKSSCPFLFVETEDGELLYQGELFPGAIFEPLERTDYLPLSFTNWSSENLLSLQIANKLKEIQYINKIGLFGINKRSNEKTTISQRGLPYTYEETASPNLLKNSDNQTVTINHEQTYSFVTDQVEVSQKSALNATFQLPVGTDNALLVLEAKNHDWLEFMWHDLSKKIGNQYMDFVSMHRNSSTTFLNNWLDENGLKLEASIKQDGRWVPIGAFELTGPLDFRKISLEIPSQFLQNGNLELQLSSGMQFWEIASIDLAINPKRAKLEKAKLVTAKDNKGTSHHMALSSIDKEYMTQHNQGDYTNIQFELPQSWSAETTDLYFQSVGYYEHQRNFPSNTDYAEVTKQLTGTGFAEASHNLLKRMKGAAETSDLPTAMR